MLDADAIYHPEDIPRVIGELENHEVVWGGLDWRGRIQKGAMSRVNRIGNILLSLTASLVNFQKNH